jgi:hypothetical protein
MHVAVGCDWRGNRVKARGCVVYIVMEGEKRFDNRVVAWRTKHGIDDIPFATIKSRVVLLDPEADTQDLIEKIQSVEEGTGLPVVMVVVDTLARAMAGGDENAGKDMTSFVSNVDRIKKETGAHVMIVHHTGKDEAKGARGHSSLRAATDTEIVMKKGHVGKQAFAKDDKQRDMPGQNEYPFDVEEIILGHDSEGTPVGSLVVVPIEELARPPKIDKLVINLQSGLMLRRAKEYIDAHGTDHKTKDGEVVRAASLGDWKAHALKGVPEDSSEARRKAWERDLKATKAIRMAGTRKAVVFWIEDAAEPEDGVDITDC